MFIGFKYLLTFIHTYLYKSISLTAAFVYLPKIFFPKILKKINNYIMDYFVFIFLLSSNLLTLSETTINLDDNFKKKK